MASFHARKDKRQKAAYGQYGHAQTASAALTEIRWGGGGARGVDDVSSVSPQPLRLCCGLVPAASWSALGQSSWRTIAIVQLGQQ